MAGVNSSPNAAGASMGIKAAVSKLYRFTASSRCSLIDKMHGDKQGDELKMTLDRLHLCTAWKITENVCNLTNHVSAVVICIC